jgi:hypothetical protein
MKSISGDLKGILLTGLLLVPFFTNAESGTSEDMANRCKLAISEVSKAGDLFSSFMDPWLKQDLDKLEIDRGEFSKARAKSFNKQYAQMRSHFANQSSFGLNDPIIRSNDVSLRLQFIVDAFQLFATDGDKPTLKASWSIQQKAMKEDIAVIKNTCSKKEL